MIVANELRKQYGKQEAIEGLTFSVPEGSAFALIGANGAGKTTTIKILMNILQPSSGHATIFGVDSQRLSANEFQRIGYVSENQQMPLALTVGEYLDYLRPFYPRWDKPLERSLVRELGLPADRRIGALSHGMRMKMALVSALPFHPDLLVLDEPFNGLDALVRDELMEGMMDLAGEMTIFISSHDLSEIDSFATEVAFVDQGRLLFQDSMETLMGRFREVQIVLEGEALVPGNIPSEWINVKAMGSVVSFVDTRFAESTMSGRLSPYWSHIQRVETKPLSLRAIFTTLARASRTSQNKNSEVSL
jgi:ABC-2 type transport system ATP-binding protein